MTISAVELHLLAESMGVQLRRHTGGCPGWYDHHRRVISTRRGQSIGQYKSVLAHELGVTVKVLKTWQTLHERQVA